MRFSEFKVLELENDPAADAQADDAARTTQDNGLQEGPPFPPEDSSAVRTLQRKLEQLGYSVGSTGVDGKYGPRTSNAVSAFKKDNNIQGDGSSMSAEELRRLQSARPVENPSPTGNEHNRVGGRDNLDDVEFAQGSSSGRVRMQNRGATRNLPLDPRLMSILERAAEDAGVDVVVFSGGQPRRGTSRNRVGSIRHDDGLAADVYIYNQGRRLRTDREDPIVARFIAAAVAAGARGIGAGPGYMDNVGIHVDLWGDRAGANMWGAGGSSSATPGYVVAAYRAGQTGNIA